MTHTSGPWVVRPEPVGDRGLRRFVGANINEDGSGRGGAERNKNAGIWIAETKGPDAEANALLIHAAPDMLEALRAAEEWLSGWASAEPYLSTIRDAIAKATTGRTWINAAPIVTRTIAG